MFELIEGKIQFIPDVQKKIRNLNTIESEDYIHYFQENYLKNNMLICPLCETNTNFSYPQDMNMIRCSGCDSKLLFGYKSITIPKDKKCLN